MSEVTVNRKDAIEKLKENRELHKEESLAARAGYNRKLKEYMLSELERLEACGEQTKFTLKKPPHIEQDHLAEYDRYCQMLERPTGDEITLTAEEFSNLILNDWHWQEAWLSNVYFLSDTDSLKRK
jgi:hypothetical protein